MTQQFFFLKKKKVLSSLLRPALVGLWVAVKLRGSGFSCMCTSGLFQTFYWFLFILNFFWKWRLIFSRECESGVFFIYWAQNAVRSVSKILFRFGLESSVTSQHLKTRLLSLGLKTKEKKWKLLCQPFVPLSSCGAEKPEASERTVDLLSSGFRRLLHLTVPLFKDHSYLFYWIKSHPNRSVPPKHGSFWVRYDSSFWTSRLRSDSSNSTVKTKETQQKDFPAKSKTSKQIHRGHLRRSKWYGQ